MIQHQMVAGKRLFCITSNRGDSKSGFDGGVDKKIFEPYMEKILLLAINRGDIVTADNLNVHKSGKIKQMIGEAGALYIPLPPYRQD